MESLARYVTAPRAAMEAPTAANLPRPDHLDFLGAGVVVVTAVVFVKSGIHSRAVEIAEFIEFTRVDRVRWITGGFKPKTGVS